MPEDEGREDVIILTDEEGEHEFTVVDVIQVEGKNYAILLPPEEEGDEAVILRIDKDEQGEDVLVDIEDDAEWERVADAWEELLDEEEESDDDSLTGDDES